MAPSKKNGTYFWLLNLLVIAIVIGILAKNWLIETQPSPYRLPLGEVVHTVTEGFVTTPDASGATAFPPGDSPIGQSLGGGKHRYLRPGEGSYREYTIAARFDFTAQYDALEANPHIVPGLMISRLGDSYEVYLNGHRLASEWHVADGTITTHTLARDIVLPINSRFLQRGENTLLFRIYGDPTTVDTGLSVAGNYAIDDLRAFNTFALSDVILAGIYLAVAGTFAIFFLLYREKKLNLWFSVTALFLSLYTLFRANVFTDLIAEYELAVRLEILMLFSFAFFAAVLLYACGKERFSRAMKMFAAVYVLFCAALLLPGREFIVDLITLYYAFLAPAIAYAFVTSLCIPLYKDIKNTEAGGRFGRVLGALSGTLRGNMLVAACIPILMSVSDQITYMLLPYQPIMLSQYGFLFFFANVTYGLASDNAEAHSKLLVLSGELRALVSEREQELRQKSGEVEEVKNAQIQLFETASAEIRAPLGEIIGAIELRLLRAGLTAESESWLRRLLDMQRHIRQRLDSFWEGEPGYTADDSPKRRFDIAGMNPLKPSAAANPGGTRHLFVINPKSFVTLKDIKNFLLSIEKCFSAGHRAEYKIYISRYPRDAYSAVHRYLSATPPDETVRVYAVGGDGILFDCLNGLARFPNAELAPIPYGNANDFARSFGAENMALFRDIKLMSQSPSRLVDAILCGQQYALCSCSIGIEAKAVQVFSKAIERINSGRARTFVPLIYVLGGIKSLLDASQNNINYRITIDGKDFSGEYLLVNTGNIALNGGSNAPNPLANPEDGFLDVILCKASTTINSLRMISAYTAGHFSKYPHYLEHYRLKEIRCESDSLMSVILDGETFYTHELDIKILPKAVHIVSPNGIGFADYSQPAKGAAT